jgi:hypothetical protein
MSAPETFSHRWLTQDDSWDPTKPYIVNDGFISTTSYYPVFNEVPMPVIIVIDPAHVTIDGEPAGSVLDVVENHAGIEGIKSLTLAAILAWDSTRQQAHEAEIADIMASHAETVAGLTVQSQQAADAAKDAAETALADKAATIATLSATLAEKHSLIDTLGGTELGQQMKRAAQLKAAQDALARAQADLEKLNEGSAQ